MEVLTERVTEKRPEGSGGAWILKAGKLREEKGTGPEAGACPPRWRDEEEAQLAPNRL